MSDISPAAIVYAEQLTPKGHGLPLWYPEPMSFQSTTTKPMASDSAISKPAMLGEALIGDVGYVSNGQFIRLFNATRPATDLDINRNGVPDGFVQLQYPEHLERTQLNYLPPGAVYNSQSTSCNVEASASVSAGVPKLAASGKYTFSCAADRAAIAMLGGPGHCYRVEDNTFFREYISQHHDAWHEFAHRQGLRISPDRIVLVYGCVKTSHWALAACSSDAASHDILFEVPSGSFASAAFRASISNNSAPAVDQRSGPKDFNGTDLPLSTTPVYNQCLFLRYYKVKTRWLRDSVIVNKVKAHDAQSTAPSATPRTPPTVDDSKKGSGFLGTLNRFVAKRAASPNPKGKKAKEKSPLRLPEAIGSLRTAQGEASLNRHVETVTSTDSVEEVYDKPLDDVLEYILAHHSEIRSAIVSHEDLYTLFPDPQYWPLDMRGCLADLKPQILFHVSTGVGTLSLVNSDQKSYYLLPPGPSPPPYSDEPQKSSTSQMVERAGWSYSEGERNKDNKGHRGNMNPLPRPSWVPSPQSSHKYSEQIDGSDRAQKGLRSIL